MTKLNQKINTKDKAIEEAGKLLYQKGCVEEEYVQSMKERDQMVSTYMGNFVAIPHGTDESKELVKESGISFLQIPEGIPFTEEGEIVKLIFGIAGKNNEHLELLSQIAILCSEMENVEALIEAKTYEEVEELFNDIET